MNFTVPNLLSLLRMAIIPLFVIALLDGQPRRALILFLTAGVTDLLDGAIARFFNQKSVLGTYLDPIADKLLLVTAYVMLTLPGAPGVGIPIWITVLVIARDAIIVVMALVLHLAHGVGSFPPSWISKVNTVAQVSAVVGVLVAALVPGWELPATVLVHVVAVLTVASGLDYIVRANRMAARRDGAPRDSAVG
jgi:cardiolipin synthase (CMP-forming)